MQSESNTLKKTLIFTLLVVLLVVFFIVDIVVGSVNLDLGSIFSHSSIYHEIVFNFRLPKALTAVLTGASISVAGLLMQTLFRNSLAGPYVLGVSSGASLGVAVLLLGGSFLPAVITQSGWGIVFAAILGAIFVLLLVLGVSFKVRQAVSLLIIGIMFGQIAGSLVTILQNQSNPDALKVFVVWTFGSLQAVTWNFMMVMLPMLFIGFLFVFIIQKQLNGLLLGEYYAKGLGISISKTRFLIIIAVALLAGTPTAFTGPIAFIGMAVPHLARGLFRTSNHKILIPAAMLCGAILLLLCDLATTQIPADGQTLPINAISALVGAPIVIWVVMKNKK